MKKPQYMKVVEWSEEDHCFVGSAPPLIGKCCHGDDEAEVFAQLAVIVDEWIDIFEKDGRPLPEARGKDFTGKFVVRVPPELHQAATIRAMQEHRSLNAFVERAIAQAVGE